MSYYVDSQGRAKKVLTAGGFVSEPIPEYEGSYNITENGTYPTADKKMTQNLIVNISSGTQLKTLLDATKKADYLFDGYNTDNISDLISYSDTSEVISMKWTFQSCYYITNIPLLDTTKVQNMYGMFINCWNLEVIPALNVSNCSNLLTTFNNCRKLSEIHMFGMKVNFDISSSTLFSESALVEILNNLASVSTTRTLTMGSTNLAKLTTDDIAIATNKGWTLA